MTLTYFWDKFPTFIISGLACSILRRAQPTHFMRAYFRANVIASVGGCGFPAAWPLNLLIEVCYAAGDSKDDAKHSKLGNGKSFLDRMMGKKMDL